MKSPMALSLSLGCAIGTSIGVVVGVLTDNLGLISASNTGSNESVAYMGRLSTLLAWHVEDPVEQRMLQQPHVVVDQRQLVDEDRLVPK